MTFGGGRFGIARGRTLDIAYEEHGAPDGAPVLLLHGFPYDVRCFDGVAPLLAESGLRVVVPYLRGYGPTRFVEPSRFRSGEQAALAHDVLDLANALQLEHPLLCGFDWGGRAACAAAALWPECFSALVAIGGYSLYDIVTALAPAPAEVEYVLWYQYYFHGGRGACGLTQHRRELCRLLWSLWSPHKPLDEPAFAATAPSFDNPDFVAIVLSSYRHRFGLAEGDPAYAASQATLAALPPVPTPAVALHGTGGPLPAAAGAPDRSKLPDLRWWRTIEGAGHNMPHEAPEAVASAILDLHRDLGASA